MRNELFYRIRSVLLPSSIQSINRLFALFAIAIIALTTITPPVHSQNETTTDLSQDEPTVTPPALSQNETPPALSQSETTTDLSQDEPTYKYKVKGIFAYAFLHFSRWPEEAFTKNSDTITIGIVGKNPFGNILSSRVGNQIQGRTVEVKYFDKETDAELLKQCHLLFFSNSYKRSEIRKILASLEKAPVLTVSDSKGFLDDGGMIAFYVSTKDGSLEFDINKKMTDQLGISFSSRVLRLANQIVEE